MTRHVKFSQRTSNDDGLKLPSININNRIAGGRDVTGKHGQSRDPFPTQKQNGYIVSRETLPEQHLTYYHNEAGSRVRAEPPPRQYKRRLQSLPSRKPKASADESPRQTNSAPSKKGNKVAAPLPKLNNLMAKIRSSERDQTYGRHWTQEHAGVSTKGHDAQNQRSQKFATSWANARAEQANLRSNDHPNVEESQKPPETKKPEASKSEASKPDHKGRQEPVGHETSTKEREQVRRKNEQTLSHMFHASDNRENRSPNQEPSRKKTESPYLALKLRSDEKRSRRERRIWNPSYVVEKPVVISPRRQEAELTHHPAITESDAVYKAYTGVTKRELRKGDDNVSRVFSQYGDVYHATITVSPRNKKEYVLTLREAETYRKINSVYGEDGVRRKRKSLLIQKLVTVDIDQIKEHNQRLREKERKREESKRRQQKQLNRIRKRFKDQQSRRFRSQYVTSRVLEHEKMNRNEFGLPEEEYEDEEKHEDVGSEMNSEKSSKKREEPKQIDKRKKKKAYEKKYKNMFEMNMGPAWDPRPKTPKMEGVDIVTVEIKDKEGNVKEEKKEVKDIMKDAKKLLKSSNKDITISEDESRTATPPRKSHQPSRRKPSLDSLDFEDDDDDDIFERARRKYNLDVDSNN